MLSKGFDNIVVGAGVAGLATACHLNGDNLVLEAEDRPGGLVKSIELNGFWFDHVLHLLHFGHDIDTEYFVRNILGDVLKPCSPKSFVETLIGTTRFPLQDNLEELGEDIVQICKRELLSDSKPSNAVSKNFKEYLLSNFGAKLCDIFYYPYNSKVWKRPLESLSSDRIKWNIRPPDMTHLKSGTIETKPKFYNQDGWYPIPNSETSARGMELLSMSLSRKVKNIECGSKVQRISAKDRLVWTSSHSRPLVYRNCCIATLPMPQLLLMIDEISDELKSKCRKLKWNRVISFFVSVQGPRPASGHWRYYASPEFIFNRLTFMHEFDPKSSPSWGFSILGEVIEPSEFELRPRDIYIDQFLNDLGKTGLLSSDHRIIDVQLLISNFGYVVFDDDHEKIVSQAREELSQMGIWPLGRYGRWEYSSMAQVIRDGLSCAKAINDQLSWGDCR